MMHGPLNINVILRVQFSSLQPEVVCYTCAAILYVLASNLEFSLEANTMPAAAGIFIPVYFMTDHQQQAADK